MNISRPTGCNQRAESYRSYVPRKTDSTASIEHSHSGHSHLAILRLQIKPRTRLEEEALECRQVNVLHACILLGQRMRFQPASATFAIEALLSVLPSSHKAEVPGTVVLACSALSFRYQVRIFRVETVHLISRCSYGLYTHITCSISFRSSSFQISSRSRNVSRSLRTPNHQSSLGLNIMTSGRYNGNDRSPGIRWSSGRELAQEEGSSRTVGPCLRLFHFARVKKSEQRKLRACVGESGH
jgi:hypothetical protein